jgi:tetratricopeptide (TPR) repeat protein
LSHERAAPARGLHSLVTLLAGVLLAAALSGCAVQAPRLLAEPPADLPRRVELAQTPFFPQDAYQCGPAALATALSAAGMPTSPEALVEQVFLPGREGSLQVEMLAGARRHGAVATRIPDTLETLMRETAAGNPVIVLQNLGLSWVPRWHYAVVIGYDLDREEFLLRSGTTERLELRLRTFEHTWDRSQRWGFVASPPGTLPVTATETDATHSLVAFERHAPPAAAVRAYRAGLARWPDSLVLAMGLGNARYAAGDKAGAEETFRHAAERHQSAAAYNNQARVLLELGRRDAARRAAQRAVQLGGALRDTALATLRAIDE